LKLVSEFDEDDLLFVVDLAEFDFDDFPARCRNCAANEAGFDGELTVAAVDEDEKLNGLGATVVEERVERRADGAACVEDVVHENDVAAVDVKADFAGFDDGLLVLGGEVVTVEADVEHAGLDGGLLDGFDKLADALGERDSAALDTDEADVGGSVVALDDLVCETDEGALDLGGGHEASLFAEARHGGRRGFGGGRLGIAHDKSMIAAQCEDRIARLGSALADGSFGAEIAGKGSSQSGIDEIEGEEESGAGEEKANAKLGLVEKMEYGVGGVGAAGLSDEAGAELDEGVGHLGVDFATRVKGEALDEEPDGAEGRDSDRHGEAGEKSKARTEAGGDADMPEAGSEDAYDDDRSANEPE
jgi:hypothetical protein